MKKLLTAIACTLALGLSATNAQALAIDDSRYLGAIIPGTPTSPADEIDYINQLITMALNATTTISGNLFDRSAIPCTPNLGGCPAATATGQSVDLAPPAGAVTVTGFEWLFAKYGGDSHVWWVGGLTTGVTIPGVNTGGQALSHYALFNATPTVTTPDGGATIGLLGFGMLALGYLRRRIS